MEAVEEAILKPLADALICRFEDESPDLWIEYRSYPYPHIKTLHELFGVRITIVGDEVIIRTDDLMEEKKPQDLVRIRLADPDYAGKTIAEVVRRHSI